MQNSIVPRLVRGLGLAVIVATAAIPPATAAPLVAPFITYTTKGGGPSEEIVAFKAAPNLSDYALPPAAIAALSAAYESKSSAQKNDAAFNALMGAVGDTQGGLGFLGTLAQHAAYIDALGDINNGLNNVGLLLATFQVARDAANGKTAEALTGGFKAWLSFAIGRWGTGPMQLGSLATFVVDITLREWKEGLLDIAHDVWWCRYVTYYRHDGKRTINGWKVKAWELYQQARLQTGKNGKSFQQLLDAEIDSYVHKAFGADVSLPLFSDCKGPGSASWFGGSMQSVMDKLAAEYKADIEAMMVTDVFPEIAERAWRQDVALQVEALNLYQVEEFNQKLDLEVTAYEVDGPAQVSIPLADGKRWSGKLKPDGTFHTRITKWALIKAGLPATIELETEAGIQTRPIAISGNRIIAIFGTPKVNFIANYRWSESAQNCITSGGSDGVVLTQVPARDTTVHVAQLRDDVFILGHYDAKAGKWTLASPGSTTGKGLIFGPPYLDHVEKLVDCGIGFLSGGGIAKGGCTIKRLETKAVSARVTLSRRCESTAKLDLVGAYAPMGGKLQYFSFEGAEGEALSKLLGLSIKKGVKNGGLPDMGLPQGPK